MLAWKFRVALLGIVLGVSVLSAVWALAVTDIVGARAQIVPIATGVTTNTTSSPAVGGVPAGRKTIFGQVVCSSGACTQTQAIYGTMNATAASGILLCTLTLSGTTRAQDACPVITAVFPFYYVITTNTSGTAATGDVVAVY